MWSGPWIARQGGRTTRRSTSTCAPRAGRPVALARAGFDPKGRDARATSSGRGGRERRVSLSTDAATLRTPPPPRRVGSVDVPESSASSRSILARSRWTVRPFASPGLRWRRKRAPRVATSVSRGSPGVARRAPSARVRDPRRSLSLRSTTRQRARGANAGSRRRDADAMPPPRARPRRDRGDPPPAVVDGAIDVKLSRVSFASAGQALAPVPETDASDAGRRRRCQRARDVLALPRRRLGATRLLTTRAVVVTSAGNRGAAEAHVALPERRPSNGRHAASAAARTADARLKRRSNRETPRRRGRRPRRSASSRSRRAVHLRGGGRRRRCETSASCCGTLKKKSIFSTDASGTPSVEVASASNFASSPRLFARAFRHGLVRTPSSSSSVSEYSSRSCVEHVLVRVPHPAARGFEHALRSTLRKRLRVGAAQLLAHRLVRDVSFVRTVVHPVSWNPLAAPSRRARSCVARSRTRPRIPDPPSPPPTAG